MTWDWTFVLTFLAALFSGAGLAIMGRQLAVARNAYGGRGMQIVATLSGIVDVDAAGLETREAHVTVQTVGPGTRHHLQVSALGLKQRPKGPAAVAKMTCESAPLEWKFPVPQREASDVWCFISWIDARSEGIRTSAVCTKFEGNGELYVWKWHRFFTARHHVQHWRSEVKPLGKWKLQRSLPLSEGHGPIALTPRPTRAENVWLNIHQR